jgi:hypothetical protein
MKASRSVISSVPSRLAGFGYSLALLLGGCATISPPPAALQGELALDARDPVIDADVQGVPMRLRVTLDAHDTIELNPAAARRLPLVFKGGIDLYVGRVLLVGRSALAQVRIGADVRSIEVGEHGRSCCAGADGAIGPQLLPYRRVVWRNPAAPPPAGTIVLPLSDDAATGLSAEASREARGIRIRFALDQGESLATAAAGAILSQRAGGRWDGPDRRIPAAFGIRRPARPVAFAQPATLAGFRFARLAVRTADFGGAETLPLDPVAPDEIVVRQPLPRQEAWPAVTLGIDRLGRCAEIAYDAAPRRLTLRCAFD